ncbi:hypothetical protein EVAR_103547_1 [Eumeta japonica]|uniref:Uncharacterized protein n=1 Tax=Eumeta variegata TaxID=151549 RepID=A0A4C1YI98_EUMVA|nr:hypothetical protein EVAR_103547_1 [Eumeta japonica]
MTTVTSIKMSPPDTETIKLSSCGPKTKTKTLAVDCRLEHSYNARHCRCESGTETETERAGPDSGTRIDIEKKTAVAIKIHREIGLYRRKMESFENLCHFLKPKRLPFPRHLKPSYALGHNA